jgi:glycosyltransferase involved in cell wall biosynthesis
MVSGERIRAFNLMRELAARGWLVSLFSLVWGRAPEPADERALAEVCESIMLQPFEPSSAARRLRLARDLALARPFQAAYFTNGAVRRGVRELVEAQDFDLVVMNQLYTYAWVPPELHEQSVLDAHNVEARRLEALARGPVLHRRLAARLQLPAVRRFEADAVQRVRRTLAVSRVEQEHLDALAPGRVRLVPNGVDTASLQPRNGTGREAQLLFLGSLTYSANADAVGYLADEILGRVRARVARVAVVGLDPGRSVYAAARRSPVPMEIVGYVDSVQPQVERSRMLVVPLRYGAGTRLKILEALARGLPVVSTSIGCEGLDLTHEREIVVADEPAEFAAWIDRLLADDALCARLAEGGRQAVVERYDWSRAGALLDEALREVVP